jgi:undecaprenyl-diphosphatase
MEARIAAPEGRLQQLALRELQLCCSAADLVGHRLTVGAFRIASRIGDWPLSVSVGLLLLGMLGWRAAAAWTAASVIAVLAQTRLKHLYARRRPCERRAGPPQRAPIPDKGSFPSGHTLHAVMAAVVTVALVPQVAAVFVLLALLVAASRVVLGVHYPSDVVAGAALGVIFGELLLFII